MSDLPPKGSTGWWQASDGKWYPPEETPEPPQATQPPATAESKPRPSQGSLKAATGCGPGFWAFMAIPVVLVAIIVLLDIAGGDDGIEVRAVMDDVEATSSSIVTIRYTLTNEAGEGGSVDCTARVDNPVGSGFATLEGYLGPNETRSFTNQIVVTNNAAFETRSASIDCE